jgi:hypothetical protein
MPLQQRALLVAVHADAVPAIVDGRPSSRRSAHRVFTFIVQTPGQPAPRAPAGAGRPPVALGRQQGSQVHQRLGVLRLQVQALR